MKRTILYAASLCCMTLLLVSCGGRQAQYKGTDISGKASIVRNKETKAASMITTIDGNWEIYAGSSLDKISKRPLMKGTEDGVYAINASNKKRSFFEVTAGESSTVVAERHLPMTGGYNFRDLGGYKGADGKHVKWGALLRSDELSSLTNADLKYLASNPVKSVVDFRSVQETESAPDRIPAKATAHKMPISPGNMQNAATDLSKLNANQAASFMQSMNIALVSDPDIIATYKDFFALLQNPENAPVLFHCTAGKDRTGMAAALILYALGVDESIIMQDYLLSNSYIKPKFADTVKQYPALGPVFEVDAAYLNAGINHIKLNYGSVDRYLREVLDVDIENFRNIYLY